MRLFPSPENHSSLLFPIARQLILAESLKMRLLKDDKQLFVLPRRGKAAGKTNAWQGEKIPPCTPLKAASGFPAEGGSFLSKMKTNPKRGVYLWKVRPDRRR